MPPAALDPVQFGEMLATLKSINEAMPTAFSKIDKLNERITELERQLSQGKGVMIGLLIAAGGAGAAVHKMLEHLL